MAAGSWIGQSLQKVTLLIGRLMDVTGHSQEQQQQLLYYWRNARFASCDALPGGIVWAMKRS